MFSAFAAEVCGELNQKPCCNQRTHSRYLGPSQVVCAIDQSHLAGHKLWTCLPTDEQRKGSASHDSIWRGRTCISRSLLRVRILGNSFQECMFSYSFFWQSLQSVLHQTLLCKLFPLQMNPFRLRMIIISLAELSYVWWCTTPILYQLSLEYSKIRNRVWCHYQVTYSLGMRLRFHARF